tara:strand:- start:516 stop:713 length:198 start_codon:yes stop_codon:yes gene_type:complete
MKNTDQKMLDTLKGIIANRKKSGVSVHAMLNDPQQKKRIVQEVRIIVGDKKGFTTKSSVYNMISN